MPVTTKDLKKFKPRPKKEVLADRYNRILEYLKRRWKFN